LHQKSFLKKKKKENRRLKVAICQDDRSQIAKCSWQNIEQPRRKLTTKPLIIYKKRTMGLIKEFKEFAMRGNVMDMAIGVIIGGAFGKIVTSLVNDILMPLVGKVLGNTDFTNLYVALSEGVAPGTSLEDARAAGASVFAYGAFIQQVVDFLIVAFCIFMVIKGINKLSNLKKKQEEEAPAAPAGPTQEELLTEIRDLLKQK